MAKKISKIPKYPFTDEIRIAHSICIETRKFYEDMVKARNWLGLRSYSIKQIISVRQEVGIKNAELWNLIFKTYPDLDPSGLWTADGNRQEIYSATKITPKK